MEVIDQKPVVSSTLSNKCSKTIADTVPTASQPLSQSVKQSTGSGPISYDPDPTRFGDWERAGRCIDF